MVEEEAKLQRKIQRAANALRNKQEKARKAAEREAKAAQKRDLESTNKPAKRAPKKKPVSIALKAKKAAPVVSTKQKAPNKAGRPAKAIVQQEIVTQNSRVVALGVIQAKTSTRAITLP